MASDHGKSIFGAEAGATPLKAGGPGVPGRPKPKPGRVNTPQNSLGAAYRQGVQDRMHHRP